MNKAVENMRGTSEAEHVWVHSYDQKTAAYNYHYALKVMPKLNLRT